MILEAPETIIGNYLEALGRSADKLGYFDEKRPFPYTINHCNNRLVICTNRGGTRITPFMKVNDLIRIVNRGSLFTLVTYDERSLVFNEQDLNTDGELKIEDWMWFAIKSDVSVSVAIGSYGSETSLQYEEC